MGRDLKCVHVRRFLSTLADLRFWRNLFLTDLLHLLGFPGQVL